MRLGRTEATCRWAGILVHTATAIAETVAIGTSHRTVEVFHHLRAGSGGAVLTITASMA